MSLSEMQERFRNYVRLKETNDIWQMDVIHNVGWILLWKLLLRKLAKSEDGLWLYNDIGLAKKFIFFSIKQKTHFSFSPIFYWFGYFEYVGYLPYGITLLFSINVLILLLPTSTGLPNHRTSSSRKSPAQNFASHFCHIWSVTAPLSYTAHNFFFNVQLLFYLSWNNKA